MANPTRNLISDMEKERIKGRVVSRERKVENGFESDECAKQMENTHYTEGEKKKKQKQGHQHLLLQMSVFFCVDFYCIVFLTFLLLLLF